MEPLAVNDQRIGPAELTRDALQGGFHLLAPVWIRKINRRFVFKFGQRLSNRHLTLPPALINSEVSVSTVLYPSAFRRRFNARLAVLRTTVRPTRKALQANRCASDFSTGTGFSMKRSMTLRP